MLKESLLDVLLYLFEHTADQDISELELYLDSEDQNESFGLPTGLDLEKALQFVSNDKLDTLLNTQKPFRVFSRHEVVKICLDARQFIVVLEMLNILNARQRELIIEHAMNSHSNFVDLDEIKNISVLNFLSQSLDQTQGTYVVNSSLTDDIKH